MIRPALLSIADDELIVDSFAGGGGASLGIEWALGRGPDIAINHNAEAIAMHRKNHPRAKHYTENVWRVDPVEACAGRPVGLMWLSPDCTHFSRARGGKPRSKKIRGLAWVAVRWAVAVRPRIICLENVEEFRTWGPVLRDSGEPCPRRKGQTYRAFVRKLERLGYEVKTRALKGSHFGAPTIRQRLFMVARCDGKPIAWPARSHGEGAGQPERVFAECVDWSLPCPSIFLTKAEAKDLGFARIKRPLAPPTLRRTARGVIRFVINNPNPFIVHVGSATVAPTLAHTAHGDVDRNGKRRGQGECRIDQPFGTVTATGDFAIVAPTLIQTGYGEDKKRNGGRGQSPRVLNIEQPLGTLVGQGNKHAIVAAFLAKHFGGHESPGQQLTFPLATVTARDHSAIVASHLLKFYGTSRLGQEMTEPAPTERSAPHHAEVRAFLIPYFGTDQNTGSLFEPLPTITSKDRNALVIVMIHGEPYYMADIGMRMISVRERFRAQGFPDSYIIDLDVWTTHNRKTLKPLKKPGWRPLSQEAQGSMVGNSVNPQVAKAIVLANCMGEAAEVAA